MGDILIGLKSGGTIKSTGDNRFEGYLVRFYDGEQRDLHDEWFSKDTDFMLDDHPIEGKPALFHHGLDAKIGVQSIGRFTKARLDDWGLWVEGIYDERKEYIAYVKRLIDEGVLDFSSGALPQGVVVNRSNKHIDRWPIIEGSATHTPADWRSVIGETGTRIQPLKALETLLKSIGAQHEGTDGDTPAESVVVEAIPKSNPGPAKGVHTGEPIMALRKRIKDVIDELVEEVLEELAGEVPAEDVEAVVEEVVAVVEEEGIDLEILEEEDALMMVDEEDDENKAEGDDEDDEDKAKKRKQRQRVQKTLGRIADLAVKAYNKRKAARRSALSGVAKAATNAAKSAPATTSAKTRNGGASGQQGNGVSGSRLTIGEDMRYAHLTPAQMALGHMIQCGRVSDEYRKAMAYKTAQAQERGDTAANDYAVKSQFNIKADEVMQIDLTGFGEEWVADYWSTNLWEMVRQESPIYEQMLSKGMDEAEIPQGFGNETIPLEGADPDWYVAAGGADEDPDSGMVTPTFNPSKYGTGEKNVTVAKLSTRINYQKELEEDSIIAIAPETERKIRLSSVEQIEYILLNGDTVMTANTNINLIDGTPAAAPARPSYTLLNGLAKLPLVTNTANSTDALNGLADTTFLSLLPLLGPNGKYAADLNRVMFIVDNSTYFAALNIATVKTIDVFPSATIVNGVLTNIFGVDLLRSAQFALANTAGKISATPSNNTRGRILLVRPDQWVSRWKRRLEVFTTYYPASDTTQVVAHMRWGVAHRDNEASAIAYNVSTTIS